MNQPFMFMPNLNPLADNAKFIKKAIKRKYTIVIAASMAAVLIAAMFGMLYSFGLSMNGATFYVSSYDQEMQGAELSGFGFKLIMLIGIFVLPAIAAVNYSVAARDKENQWFPASVTTLAKVFLIMYMLAGVYWLFSSLGSMGVYALLEQMGETSAEANLFTDVFLMKTVPSFIEITWAIGGLVFINSFNKTVRCLRLTDKGAGFFGIISLLMVITNIVLVIVYDVNGFKGGLFFSSQGTDTLSIAINQNMLAKVCFNLFYIGCTIAVFMIMLFSTEFSKAVKKARVSLEAGGANLYMNGDSVNAAYYQGYYNGQPAYGQPVPPVQPPVPVNMGYPPPPFNGAVNNPPVPPVQYANNYQVHPENNIPAPPVANAPVYPVRQETNPPIPPAEQPVKNMPAAEPVMNNTDNQQNSFVQPAEDLQQVHTTEEPPAVNTGMSNISADKEQLAPVQEEEKENTVICRACGAENPTFSKYCIECGNMLMD